MDTHNAIEWVKVRMNDNKKMVITNSNGDFETTLFWDEANEAVLTRNMNAHKLIGYICDQVYGKDMFKGYATGLTFKKIFNVFATYYYFEKDCLDKINGFLMLEFEIFDEGTDDCGHERWREKIHVFEGNGRYLFSINMNCNPIYDGTMEDAHV